MNILFLSHRIPYPPNKGDKIRSYNEIVYLSQKHTIYLGTILENETDESWIQYLKPYCRDIRAVRCNPKHPLFLNIFRSKPFSVAYFYHRSLQEYVDATLGEKQIDAVICFCSSMAEYVLNSRQFREGALQGVRLIMDFVDLDSDKWLQYSSFTRFPLSSLYRIEHHRLWKYELQINALFHHSLFVSQREVDTLKNRYPAARNVKVISNGVDHGFFTPKQDYTLHQNPTLVFTGVMDYFANVDGVIWFCRSIFPHIQAAIPNVRFIIVGNRPTNAVKNLARMEGVVVTGFVEDIRQYYWSADVSVIPLRIARGLQNKVLEAMATGNAVVSTSNARNGILCHENQDIVIADDEAGFAREVIRLLRDETRRTELGRNAVENIRKHYTWDDNLRLFDEILQ